MWLNLRKYHFIKKMKCENVLNDASGTEDYLQWLTRLPEWPRLWHRVALGRKLYSKYFFMLQLKTKEMALQYIWYLLFSYFSGGMSGKTGLAAMAAPVISGMMSGHSGSPTGSIPGQPHGQGHGSSSHHRYLFWFNEFFCPIFSKDISLNWYLISFYTLQILVV